MVSYATKVKKSKIRFSPSLVWSTALKKIRKAVQSLLYGVSDGTPVFSSAKDIFNVRRDKACLVSTGYDKVITFNFEYIRRKRRIVFFVFQPNQIIKKTLVIQKMRSIFNQAIIKSFNHDSDNDGLDYVQIFVCYWQLFRLKPFDVIWFSGKSPA